MPSVNANIRVQNYSPTIIGRAIIISRHRLNRPTRRPAMVIDHLNNPVKILRAHSPHNPVVSRAQFSHNDRTVMVNALQHGNLPRLLFRPDKIYVSRILPRCQVLPSKYFDIIYRENILLRRVIKPDTNPRTTLIKIYHSTNPTH